MYVKHGFKPTSFHHPAWLEDHQNIYMTGAYNWGWVMATEDQGPVRMDRVSIIESQVCKVTAHWFHNLNVQKLQWHNLKILTDRAITKVTMQLEIGRIGMRNVHPKGSMSFALKFGQNWQE